MSRWHKLSCKAPEIHIDGELPRCRGCESAPDLEYLISKRSKSSAPWEASPDKPIGKLNLHWPSCVRYRRLQDSLVAGKAELDEGELSYGEAESTSTPVSTALTPTVTSYIYDKSLRRDELRLLCVDSAPINREKSPVHVNLEIYSDDHCPEYEALSYAWGEEDGNKAQIQPLYVGPYWDIMLQTKNCWHALRYLRPCRGVRMVWIDAICINQENMVEREEQVAKMGKIYSRCLRAVVWLGDDIVKSNQPGRDCSPYPTRCFFDDLVPTKPNGSIGLTQMLKLQYFQRIWIIQELILPPELIIPVQGKEFLVNQSRLNRINHPWEMTDTPWFKYICTGSSLMRQNLYEIMHDTWRSCATDPRDKIFGTLGLTFGDSFALQIKPDYSISNTHVYIGAVAHVLLNLKKSQYLLGSFPRHESWTFPSWLSNWDNRKDLDYAWKMRSLYERFPQHGFWPLDPVPDRWHKLFNRSQKGSHIIKILNRNAGNWKRSLYRTNLGARWYHDASVDPSTATLSINLIHLVNWESRDRPQPSPLGIAP